MRRRLSDAPLVLVRRLRHQSLKRGTSENGILLGRFAEGRLDSMNLQQLREYEEIIAENDIDLFNWLSGLRLAPERYRSSALFAEISQFYQSSGAEAQSHPLAPGCGE